MILMTSVKKEDDSKLQQKYEGRCMRCKCQREIKNKVFQKNARGLNTVQGNCPVCNTKVFRILPKTK